MQPQLVRRLAVIAGLHALDLHQPAAEDGQHEHDGQQRDAQAPARLAAADGEPARRARRLAATAGPAGGGARRAAVLRARGPGAAVFLVSRTDGGGCRRPYRRRGGLASPGGPRVCPVGPPALRVGARAARGGVAGPPVPGTGVTGPASARYRSLAAPAAGTAGRAGIAAALCHGVYPGTLMAATAPLPASVCTLPVLRLRKRSSPAGRMPSPRARLSITCADWAAATCSWSICRCLASASLDCCSLVIWNDPSASVVLMTSAHTSAPPSRTHSNRKNGSCFLPRSPPGAACPARRRALEPAVFPRRSSLVPRSSLLSPDSGAPFGSRGAGGAGWAGGGVSG